MIILIQKLKWKKGIPGKIFVSTAITTPVDIFLDVF